MPIKSASMPVTGFCPEGGQRPGAAAHPDPATD